MTASPKPLRDHVSLLLLSGIVVWFFWPLVSGTGIVAERDALSLFLPLKLFLARSLWAGSLPWWNPSPVLGKPFLAEWLPGVFYPGNLILLIPPFERGFNLSFVAHYWLAAAGFWLLLRTLGASGMAASLGAITWVLGGPMLSLGYLQSHLMSVAWLPWILLAWLRPRLLTTRIALTGALLSLPILAGSPEMTLIIVAALLLVSRDLRALATFPLAAALAAPQLLPTILFLRETYRGQAGLSSLAVMAYSASFAELRQIVWFDGVLDPEPYLRSVYVGWLPVLLAVVSLAAAPRRTRLLLVGAAGLLAALALGSHTPVYPLLYAHLPFASLVRFPEKYLLGLHTLIAGGAGFGSAYLETVLRSRLGLTDLAARRQSTSSPARNAPSLVVAVLVVLGAWPIVKNGRNLLYAPLPAEILEPPPLALAMNGAVAEPSPGLGGGHLRYYADPRGAPEARSVAEAAMLDRELLFGATGELYGLRNLNTPSGLNLMAHERFHRVLGNVPRDVGLDAISALGVSFVTTWRLMEGASGVVPVEVPAEARARLYRLERTQPRAFIAERVLIAADADAALERFVTASVGEHRGLAILSAGDADSLAQLEGRLDDSRAEPAGKSVEAIRWVEDEGNHITLAVNLDRASLLVVNDSWFPGWTAEVDGRAKQLLRVNGLVRGLVIASGSHRVAMRFVPQGLHAGLAMASVTLIALLVVAAGRARARLRVSSPEAGRRAIAHPLKYLTISRQRPGFWSARKGM